MGPKGLCFRPTTGRVKEYIFSIISEEIKGTRVLDLFSGLGSLGIEALSRGADEAVFVDRSMISLGLLKKNLEQCHFLNRANIIRGNVFLMMKKFGKKGDVFDFIFADPPFKDSLREQIVESTDHWHLLKPGGLLVLEHDKNDRDKSKCELKLLKQRHFGHCVVSIYC